MVIAGLLFSNRATAQSEPYAYATVREISDQFGPAEVKKLQDLLNSPQFQSPLAKYSCGDPVPQLTFSVSLRRASYATTRAVNISYTPGFSPSVNSNRCLMFAVDYLLDKAVAGLDPDPKEETTREPHCDCSKRNGNSEWVDFPGPDEILAPKRVAAKDAALQADADQQIKEADLQPIHFDPAGVQVTPAAGEALVIHETSLGKLPPGAALAVASRDFTHWACVAKPNGKESVMLDGVEGKAYDEIPDHQELEFSPDGKHLAYVARLKDKMMVVVDGTEGKSYKYIEELFHPRFSPDSRHLAYIATVPALALPPEKWVMVLDGKEQKSYDLVEGISFSPDSQHLAYNADRGWNRGTSVVLDGKEGPVYDQISGTRFSPDGKRIAYVAFNRPNRSSGSMGTHFAVVDGKEEKHYKSVSSIQFSPDSQHITYVAGSGMKILVRDGAELRYSDGSGTFSPDSQHLAYSARFGANWLVLVDGKRLDPQPQPPDTDAMFSPINYLSFSPDSRHIVYVRREETNSVVLDGNVIATYNWVSIAPAFTRDGRRLAYVAGPNHPPGEGLDGKAKPVFGGFEGKEYDQMLTWRAELDEGGQTFGFTLDEKGVFHGIAVRDGEVLRLELEIVKK
jgi:Tol biopolymer transport system component